MVRTTLEVFEDHLACRLEGRLEEDLRRNYAPDVVLLTSNSNRQGHDAIRTSAARLREQLPEGTFTFLSKQVRGDYALLLWRSQSARFEAIDGADSFHIREGKIVFQSIQYKLT